MWGQDTVMECYLFLHYLQCTYWYLESLSLKYLVLIMSYHIRNLNLVLQ